MNTMNINCTRPTRARRIIASTQIDSMLDAFWILQAVADSLSTAEHAAGFDLIESGRESELTRLADELDGTALDLLNKLPRSEFNDAPTLDNIINKIRGDVRSAAIQLGHVDPDGRARDYTSYREALEAMAAEFDEAQEEEEADSSYLQELECARAGIITGTADLDDAGEFARGCLSPEITARGWGYAFTVNSPYNTRPWYGADSYAGAVEAWLRVFGQIEHARRLQAANNADE